MMEMDAYRLQSRCIRGETVETNNVDLLGATTPDEALVAAHKIHSFINGSPTCFAGTMYEIQRIRIETVRVGEQIVLG